MKLPKAIFLSTIFICITIASIVLKEVAIILCGIGIIGIVAIEGE